MNEKFALNKYSFFHFFERCCDLIFFCLQPLINIFGDYVCKSKLDENCHAFAHLMCHCKKQKTLLLFGGISS
jgi:hypothetical protein